jgi:hypothetical protein
MLNGFVAAGAMENLAEAVKNLLTVGTVVVMVTV